MTTQTSTSFPSFLSQKNLPSRFQLDFLPEPQNSLDMISETFSNKSTNSLSSSGSYTEDIQTSSNEGPFEMIIDVKKRKRVFNSYEERRRFKEDYQRKIKTELCKNWQLKGSCRYGNNCSFAHGKTELKEKTHLHSNYKTKPCQQYFLKGHCIYGYRCQYLHSEIKYLPEYRQFLLEAYESTNLNAKRLLSLQPESFLLEQLAKLYCESTNLKEFFNKSHSLTKKRLPCFSGIPAEH